jgi:hypothetical protein
MAKTTKGKTEQTLQLPVSARALKQRINRKLKSEQRELKEARAGSRIFNDCGRYFVIDHRINGVLYSLANLDLEKFGREVGALRPVERLVDDET